MTRRKAPAMPAEADVDSGTDLALPICQPRCVPAPNRDQEAFLRIQGDRVLSRWEPSGDGKGMEDIPEFLLR